MKMKSQLLLFFGLAIALVSCSNDEDPTLSEMSVFNISYESAQVRVPVSIDDDENITSCGICWGKASNPGFQDSVVYSAVVNSVFCAGLSDLLPNETYYVRAFAKTSNGTVFGAEKVIKTKTLSISIDTVFVDSTSCQFKVNAQTDYTLNTAQPTAAGLKIGRSPSSLSDLTHTIPTANTLTYWGITKLLEPEVTYYYKVFLVTKFDTIFSSSIGSFTTKKGTPPANILL